MGRSLPRRPLLAMDKSARRWLARTAQRNYWRVAAWMDLDDLIQDGLMCWQVMCRRYPEVRDRRHRMSLFTRIYTNHLHALANKRSMQAPEQPVLELPDTEPCGYAELLQLVYDAPAELRDCLLAILKEPALLIREHLRYPDGRRETTNEWLCRMIGLDPERYDLHGQLNELLGRE